jgi:hypothetical protein
LKETGQIAQALYILIGCQLSPDGNSISDQVNISIESCFIGLLLIVNVILFHVIKSGGKYLHLMQPDKTSADLPFSRIRFVICVTF